MSEREKKREKVLLMIERAVHEGTPVEEARTVAMQAVRLIKEYDLLNPVVLHHPSVSVHSSGATRTNAEDFASVLSDLFRDLGHAVQTPHPFSRQPPQRPMSRDEEDRVAAYADYTPRRPDRPPVSSVERPGNGAPRIIRSKLGGTCKSCGELFYEGERVWWRKGHGSTHEVCGNSVLA